MPGRNLLRLLIVCAFAAGVAVQGAAWAAEAQGDKSRYGVLAPTPDDALRDFTPDRPSRAISPFTVDAGRFQIESDFFNTSFMRQGGMTTRIVQAADPVLKLGLTSAIDLAVAFAGFMDVRMTDQGSLSAKGRGFGDVTVATKINLIGNDDGKIAFALTPYVIIPSGTRNVSAGQMQGGVIAPLAIKLPQDFSLTLQTEIDALANVNGPGTHVAFTDIVNVSHPIPGIKNLTGTAELYSQVTTEAHAPNIYTFDLALAYLVEPNTQLDAGVNIGLNRGAPNYQAFSGVAHRF